MQDLINLLKNTTPVQNWDSINFGILPGEAPKGFVFPMVVSPQSLSYSKSTYMVAIAISGTTLNGLSSAAMELALDILAEFQNPTICLPGDQGGSVKLEGDIDIELPQSYTNQGHISKTNGFFTSLSFRLSIA